MQYIYCISDFEQAIEDGLKDWFGEELIGKIQESIIKDLENYVNLYRFYDRNCSGCVGGNKDCDFAYGRKNAEGAWKKAKAGTLFDCPCRVNGTMSVSDGVIERIDLSDRNKPHYPVVKLTD